MTAESSMQRDREGGEMSPISTPTVDSGGTLQFAYRAMMVDDAVNMGLHYILQHLNHPGTYTRVLFVDFSF